MSCGASATWSRGGCSPRPPPRWRGPWAASRPAARGTSRWRRSPTTCWHCGPCWSPRARPAVAWPSAWVRSARCPMSARPWPNASPTRSRWSVRWWRGCRRPIPRVRGAWSAMWPTTCAPCCATCCAGTCSPPWWRWPTSWRPRPPPMSRRRWCPRPRESGRRLGGQLRSLSGRGEQEARDARQPADVVHVLVQVGDLEDALAPHLARQALDVARVAAGQHLQVAEVVGHLAGQPVAQLWSQGAGHVIGIAPILHAMNAVDHHATERDAGGLQLAPEQQRLVDGLALGRADQQEHGAAVAQQALDGLGAL